MYDNIQSIIVQCKIIFIKYFIISLVISEIDVFLYIYKKADKLHPTKNIELINTIKGAPRCNWTRI